MTIISELYFGNGSIDKNTENVESIEKDGITYTVRVSDSYIKDGYYLELLAREHNFRLSAAIVKEVKQLWIDYTTNIVSEDTQTPLLNSDNLAKHMHNLLDNKNLEAAARLRDKIKNKHYTALNTIAAEVAVRFPDFTLKEYKGNITQYRNVLVHHDFLSKTPNP